MKKYQIVISFIIIVFSTFSCKDKTPTRKAETQKENFIKKDSIKSDTLFQTEETEQTEKTFKKYSSKYLKLENASVNHHKIILSPKEFHKIYTKIDSTKTELWECGNPFDWLDKDWMTTKYGSVNGDIGSYKNFDGKITTFFSKEIEFDTNNHIVLFNSASAKKNSFQIPSHQINLDSNTTIEEFRKIFPDAELEKLEKPNEFRFRFYLDHKVDDAFLFYFKNGKLDYFTLWWLLC